jgi:hypothetical protein
LFKTNQQPTGGKKKKATEKSKKKSFVNKVARDSYFKLFFNIKTKTYAVGKKTKMQKS